MGLQGGWGWDISGHKAGHWGPAWRLGDVPGSMARVSQPSPLSPAWQRAQELADSGDLAGARAVLERAVELGKVNLSEDDPDVLRTAYQLGTVLQKADDPAGARRVLEEAYAAGSWRLGDSDALMVEISHDIGVVAEELGNRHEARKAFGRVAEFGPAALGGGIGRSRGRGLTLGKISRQMYAVSPRPNRKPGLGRLPRPASTLGSPRHRCTATNRPRRFRSTSAPAPARVR
ncbi:tetratricopeptide repeat protein [Paractinoplanes durhamensis]|uniref:tetratricopeptide repeat protein n=1 Tax=Paractinoplanes durhamensis TaxID=113563 RepID=UPI0036383097